MGRKLLLACGVLSSLVYVVANVVSSIRWPEYRSLSQTISELSAIGAPSRSTWVPFGLAYAALVIAFGIGVWRSAARPRLRVTAALLIAIGALGPFWPPMHLRGAAPTLTETLHIVFASVSSLCILTAIACGATAFGRRFRAYSIATIAILLASGFATSLYAPRIAANQPTPYVGVWERIDLGAYLVWVAVLAVGLLRGYRQRNSAAAA